MTASLLLLALVAQTPAAPAQEVTQPRAPFDYLRPQLFAATGAELAVAAFAGPLSPAPGGPGSSAPSLSLGLELSGREDSPYWTQRRTHFGLVVSWARFADGGTSLGASLGVRVDLTETRLRPFLGYEVGVRRLALPGGSGPTLGLDLVPHAGLALRLGRFGLLADAGPHFFGTPSQPQRQWWRTRLALTVRL